MDTFAEAEARSLAGGGGGMRSIPLPSSCALE